MFVAEILKKIFKSKNTEKLSSDIFLLDVRSRSEFAAGSSEKANNIPLDQLLIFLHSIPENKKIVVFCTNGNRSKAAKAILEQNGFNDIQDAQCIENLDQYI